MTLHPTPSLPSGEVGAYDELASLRHDLAVEHRKRMFLQWKLIAIRSEGIVKPQERAKAIAKADAALDALGDPKLEREISDAANALAASEAERERLKAELAGTCHTGTSP